MSFYLKVAGVTHEGRQRVLRQMVVGQPLKFQAEPDNPYDLNAVKINTLDGVNVGYVPRVSNYQISQNLRNGIGEYKVTVASITGGGFNSFYGCNILVEYFPNTLNYQKNTQNTIPKQSLGPEIDDDVSGSEPVFDDAQIYQCDYCSSIFDGDHAKQSWHWPNECPYCFAPRKFINDIGPISVGREIRFGRYPQGLSDNIYQPIRWIVISTGSTEGLEYATLLSKYVIDIRPIDSSAFGWRDCNLRKWLNNDFLEESFSHIEKRHLLTYQKDDPTTVDRVWIPDNSQVTQLEQTCKEDLIANVTQRVKQIYSLNSTTIGWWLSETESCWYPQDYDSSKRAYISETGSCEGAEGDVFLGIRPIVAISFNSQF